ncbi:prenyltransferase [Aeromicrobium tamlense]|uniref:Prenyltransferase n=1 Tax=Aeromicrobium tamlense TaxID=375541 RepID=A0A8I0FYL0_9ACTN|nr:prenyltransferase [Aeromicrobium tamlense]MBD1269734.1 prenyltransferase [Aeromicrobium tamlense]NYI39610.1 4-hydroxybenzoate polyprenyltransferase [Aeromicrobium tamlense]
MSRAGQVLASSRPLSWINTAFPFGAAYLLADGGLDAAFWIGCIWFLIPYNLMMYGINDVFDYESDLRNPRKGGVEGIVLDQRVHRLTIWSSVVTNVPFVVVLAAMGSAVSNLVLAISIFAVIAYSAPVLRFKERPFLDSITSSTHFVSPAVFGLALAAARGSDVEVTVPVVAALLGFFAWGIGSHAFGAVQDVMADRAAGIGSIGTALGARNTTWFALGAYLLGGVCLLLLPWPGTLAALLVLPYVANIWPYRSITDATCEEANVAWRRFLWLNFLTGFLVTQLLIWITLT